MMRSLLWLAVLVGCDRSLLVGDAQHPTIEGSFAEPVRALPQPKSPRLGLVWLGPSGPLVGESHPVPLGDFRVPLASPPPDRAVFHFVDGGSKTVAALARALVFAFDDRDGDETAVVSAELEVQPPDGALALEQRLGLLYWVTPPTGDGPAAEAPHLTSSSALATDPSPQPGFELADHSCAFEGPWNRLSQPEPLTLDLSSSRLACP